MAHRYRDPYSGKIKSQRYARKYKHRKRMKKLYKMGADRWYPWPVGWSDYDWDPVTYRGYPAERAFLVRNYRGKRSKYLKTCGHRKNRRKHNWDITNYTYNKNFDFWWELD